MSGILLSLFGVILAFRGSYLIKTAKSKEQEQFGLAVSLSAAVISGVAIVLTYV